MLNHIELGQGPPLVLVHGMAASLNDWEAILPRLAETGRRVLAVDLLGHGGSPKPSDPDAYTIIRLLESFDEWIEGQGLEKPFHLAGHSLGGYVCLAYALNHPEHTASVVLVNPLYKPSQLLIPLTFLERFHKLGERLLGGLPSGLVEQGAAWAPLYLDGIPPQVRRQKARDLKRASPHILRLASQIPDLSPRLAQIQPPVLLIWSDRDRTLEPASFPTLACLLPDVTSRLAPRCGHQTHIIRPQEVTAWMLEFLEQNAVRGSKPDE